MLVLDGSAIVIHVQRVVHVVVVIRVLRVHKQMLQPGALLRNSERARHRHCLEEKASHQYQRAKAVKHYSILSANASSQRLHPMGYNAADYIPLKLCSTQTQCIPNNGRRAKTHGQRRNHG